MLYITFVELIYLITESLYLLTTFIQLLLSLPSALVITNLISFPMHLFVCLFLKYNWTYNTMLVPVTQHAAAAAAKSLQLCPTLCDPTDGSPRGSPVPGILQARTPEWVAISFSNAWKWKVKVKSLSRVWLLATPWTAAYQAPPSMGFARQEYWSRVLLLSLVTQHSDSIFLCFSKCHHKSSYHTKILHSYCWYSPHYTLHIHDSFILQLEVCIY